MSNITALEWFASEIVGHLGPANGSELLTKYNQAKEMEKEQIKEAFKHGELPPLFVNFDAEQYYNEIYGK